MNDEQVMQDSAEGPQKIVASGGIRIQNPTAAIPTEDEESE